MRDRGRVVLWVALVILSSVLAMRVVAALSEDENAATTTETDDTLSGKPADPGDVGISARSFARADCVVWDQLAGTQDASVVDCAEPHLVEMVTSLDVGQSPDAPYPSQTEFDQIFKDQCGPVANDYLNGALDPFGRFTPSGLGVSAEGWSQGDRTIWCGLGLVADPALTPEDDPVAYTPFTGRVADLDQSYVVPVGTCLDHVDSSNRYVPCTAPHHLIVVGEVDLTGEVDRPSDVEIVTRCGEAPVGPNDPPGLRMTFLGFAAESWAAGSRRGSCAHGAWDENGEPVLIP